MFFLCEKSILALSESRLKASVHSSTISVSHLSPGSLFPRYIPVCCNQTSQNSSAVLGACVLQTIQAFQINRITFLYICTKKIVENPHYSSCVFKLLYILCAIAICYKFTVLKKQIKGVCVREIFRPRSLYGGSSPLFCEGEKHSCFTEIMASIYSDSTALNCGRL